MASQTRSIRQGVDGREDRHGANSQSDHECEEHQIPIPVDRSGRSGRRADAPRSRGGSASSSRCTTIGADPQVHLVRGKPVLAISRLVNEKQINLLVMPTVCRTGIHGFFIGNTAEEVLERVACSLLTAKPEGFVSPI